MRNLHEGRFAAGLFGGLLLGMVGCAPASLERMNPPHVEEGQSARDIQQYFAYHHDQGMIADMAIADIHFVPHTSQLSGVGEARLERYSELLAARGGEIRYETSLRDEDAINARMTSAREFLADSLPSNQKIEVVTGLPGGPGMRSTESIPGKAVAKQPEKRGTAYKLKVSSGGSQ